MKKVLIANRGEIAVRIAQTLQQMGIRVVAVCSDPDRLAPHVLAADEVYVLGGTTPAESYLRQDLLLEAARQRCADAIHPGYGFLSENATFAQACEDAGLTFIGPRSEVIRSMGDKVRAKEMMAKAGVPVVPGFSGEGDLAAEARRIGYPILIKAAAGGGGKGMRRVDQEAHLMEAVEAAAREAGSAFKDARVFLEKYIERPRHVEFQIFGDNHGNVVHLFVRECSIQRRHQKIIEETPSPALTPELRQRMAEAAVTAARTLGYTNAGTVEFILAPDGQFYFLEVNTRLQVEHPVTELTLQQDLVRAQVLVAMGEPLPFRQEDLHPRGHAIECRIYAEAPERGFMPGVGTLQEYRPPVGPGIRVDSGVRAGSEVTVHYDPMLAKLAVWAGTREQAVARMRWALQHFVVMGVANNVEFLDRVLAHPEFAAGHLHTHFLELHPECLQPQGERPPEVDEIATWVARRKPESRAMSTAGAQGPWALGGGWRQF